MTRKIKNKPKRSALHNLRRSQAIIKATLQASKEASIQAENAMPQPLHKRILDKLLGIPLGLIVILVLPYGIFIFPALAVVNQFVWKKKIFTGRVWPLWIVWTLVMVIYLFLPTMLSSGKL